MLIVLTSHPIQYQAPLWRALAEEFGKEGGKGHDRQAEDRSLFQVWFLTDQGVRHTEDKDFGKAFAWDVDLLAGYPHRFLELRGRWDLRKFNGIPLARPIAESLQDAGATALWVEGWRFKPFWDAVSAAKKMGIPVFLRGETSDKIAEKAGIFGIFRNAALNRIFRKVDHFLAIGQASRRFYLKHGVSEHKLVDAPYCVDNEFFRSESEKLRDESASAPGGSRATRETLRKEWNIAADAKVVMFCGKFVAKKRPMDLVDAARVHYDEGNSRKLKGGEGRLQPWHLLFVGSGELGNELRAACRVQFDGEEKPPKPSNPGAPPSSFVGFLNQSQICKAYAVADVLVLPSEAWETWGLVVNEATAAGIPTVVSDLCGCADDFSAKNPGTRIFPTGNIAELAKAIDAALALDLPPQEIAAHADAFAPRLTAESVARLLC